MSAKPESGIDLWRETALQTIKDAQMRVKLIREKIELIAKSGAVTPILRVIIETEARLYQSLLVLDPENYSTENDGEAHA